MDPERMIADLEARARDLARRSRQVQDQIRQAAATQRSPDGAVTATVAPNGSLRHIEFSPDAAAFSHARLGQVVMATVRRAHAEAARQVASIVEPQFGGTAAMGFLTGSLPEPQAPHGTQARPEPQAPQTPQEPLGAPEPDPPLPRSLWAPDEAEFPTGSGTAVR